jgi:hypothetical protein
MGSPKIIHIVISTLLILLDLYILLVSTLLTDKLFTATWQDWFYPLIYLLSLILGIGCLLRKQTQVAYIFLTVPVLIQLVFSFVL